MPKIRSNISYFTQILEFSLFISLYLLKFMTNLYART
jgi:hypothetical protein